LEVLNGKEAEELQLGIQVRSGGAGDGGWYRKYTPNDRILETFEMAANDNKWGLWVDKNPLPPWERRRHEK
jgi:hypothetical protein